MARDKSFHDYVIYDVLGSVMGITSRPMFSGWAIYQDGVVFGIIIGTELYFNRELRNGFFGFSSIFEIEV
ncbi:MAG: hypothetical protein A2908_03425 [Candidatus Staskawiczbacteria bacterium RIFCSPLOWO2_01_FULL_38_12b]|uniref:TfoX N-terminal domain-containing protein n=1 Tax=Candidatus Staskawiczbacteria bacterium RIFCSPLOWO2_01_FULL_38_12b TaxID=1802214 RepID=A0A1G2IH53_9BACT|nr:MAG: hypothetical protein A2908_03425 [Candidatus Staskawiczbacteria bacterium RIFCSPLOWO2_01_FULL_38_12b]